MVSVHHAVAFVVIATCFGAATAGGWAYFRKTEPRAYLTHLLALALLARIAFFGAIAYFVFLVWREQRHGISMWPQRAQVVFYGSAIVAVADVGVYWYGRARGMEVIAFVATLALCGLAMFRTWR